MKDKLLNMAMDIRGNPHERINALDRLIANGWIGNNTGGISKEEYDRVVKQRNEASYKYTLLNMDYYDMLEKIENVIAENDKLRYENNNLEENICKLQQKIDYLSRINEETSGTIIDWLPNIVVALIVMGLLIEGCIK